MAYAMIAHDPAHPSRHITMESGIIAAGDVRIGMRNVTRDVEGRTRQRQEVGRVLLARMAQRASILFPYRPWALFSDFAPAWQSLPSRAAGLTWRQLLSCEYEPVLTHAPVRGTDLLAHGTSALAPLVGPLRGLAAQTPSMTKFSIDGLCRTMPGLVAQRSDGLVTSPTVTDANASEVPTQIPAPSFPPGEAGGPDSRAASAAWRILFLVAAVLHADIPHDPQGLQHAVVQRIKRIDAGELFQLMEELAQKRYSSTQRSPSETTTTVDSGVPAPPAEVPPETEGPPVAPAQGPWAGVSHADRLSRVKRARRLCQAGELSKAMRCITSTAQPASLADSTGPLRALHPEGAPRRDLIPGPTVPDFQVTSGEVVNMIHKLPRMNSAAECHMPYDLLKSWVPRQRSRRSRRPDTPPVVVEHLTAVLNLLYANCVPQELRSYFAGGALIPLSKPNGGVRPITVGGVLRRLASKCAMHHFHQVFARLLEPIQLAAGTPHGTTIQGQILSVLTEAAQLAAGHGPAGSQQSPATASATPTPEDPLVVALVDYTNAFGSVDRNVLVATAIAACPPLTNYIHLLYDEPGLLIAQDNMGDVAFFKASEGTSQGDSLSMAFFSLALQVVLLPMACQAAGSTVTPPQLSTTASLSERILHLVQCTGVGITAYADDVAVFGPLSRVRPVVLALRERSERVLGLRSQPAKSRLWLSASALAATVGGRETLATNFRLEPECIHTDGLVILGTPLGTPNFIREHLSTIRANWFRGWSRLPSLADPRLEALLICKCIMPAITHHLRTIPASLLQEHVRAFDEWCSKQLARLLHPHGAPGPPPPLEPWQRDRAAWPVAHGGMGCPKAADTLPPALIAAWADGTAVIRGFADNTCPLQPLPDNLCGQDAPRELPILVAAGPAPEPLDVTVDDQGGPLWFIRFALGWDLTTDRLRCYDFLWPGTTAAAALHACSSCFIPQLLALLPSMADTGCLQLLAADIDFVHHNDPLWKARSRTGEPAGPPTPGMEADSLSVDCFWLSGNGWGPIPLRQAQSSATTALLALPRQADDRWSTAEELHLQHQEVVPPAARPDAWVTRTAPLVALGAQISRWLEQPTQEMMTHDTPTSIRDVMEHMQMVCTATPGAAGRLIRNAGTTSTDPSFPTSITAATASPPRQHVVYTDGSAELGSPGDGARVGGAGVFWPEHDDLTMSQALHPRDGIAITNNRAEVAALDIALTQAQPFLEAGDRVRIVSDSVTALRRCDPTMQYQEQQFFTMDLDVRDDNLTSWRIQSLIAAHPVRLVLEWTAGHSAEESPDARGNAQADRLAREGLALALQEREQAASAAADTAAPSSGVTDPDPTRLQRLWCTPQQIVGRARGYGRSYSHAEDVQDTESRLRALQECPPGTAAPTPGRLFRAVLNTPRHRQHTVTKELSLSRRVGALLGSHSGWHTPRAALNQLLFNMPGAVVFNDRPHASWRQRTKGVYYALRRYWTLLMRSRLGMRLCGFGHQEAIRCQCGKDVEGGYHFPACSISAVSTQLHNATVRTLVDIIQEHNLADHGSLQWVNIDRCEGAVPDIQFRRTIEGQITHVLIDVSMVGTPGRHILGQAPLRELKGYARARALHDGGALCTTREQVKRRHYRALIRRLRAQGDKVEFIPFVCQSMGGVGPAAWRFINRMAGWAAAASDDGSPFLSLRRGMLARIGLNAAASWATITAKGCGVVQLDPAVRFPELGLIGGPPPRRTTVGSPVALGRRIRAAIRQRSRLARSVGAPSGRSRRRPPLRRRQHNATGGLVPSRGRSSPRPSTSPLLLVESPGITCGMSPHTPWAERLRLRGSCGRVVPYRMMFQAGLDDQLRRGTGPLGDPDPPPPLGAWPSASRGPSAGAGVSDSGLVDSHQRLVSMSRSAALNNTSVASSVLSLPACVSHLSPCPLAVSDISSASQFKLSEVSPPTHSVAEVVSRCSGIDSSLSCHASSSGLE